MRVDSIKTLAGPNIYSHKPVLLMRLYLDELKGKESTEVERFTGRLLERLPGIKEHHCALGRPGGFVTRLQEGTSFGHVVEHVALELSEAAGIPVYYGRTRPADEPGCYNVVVEYSSEQGMRYLLRVAVELVEALIKQEPFALDERLEEARRIICKTGLGPSTRAVVDAAEQRGIPYIRLNDQSLVQLGYGKHRKLIQAAMTDRTSAIGVDIASDKQLTKQMLQMASIPVPRGEVVHTEDEAVAVLADLGEAVVVKPLDGRQGKGVSVNLTTEPEVRGAYRLAREFSNDVMVEELFRGRNYRVLVIAGRVVAASERLPTRVVGDGSHTIAELIEITNRDPLRGDGHGKPLTKIVIDSTLTEHLGKRGLTLRDVPAQGEEVPLRESINLSTGGTARDVTDSVHPDIADMCERAAQRVGLDICGVDLVVDDISLPYRKGCGGIIEVNASPGIRMHHFPGEGEARNVGKAIVDTLYPPGSEARIPIFSITGTNGKTSVTRLIGHVMSEAGKTVGMTTTDGIWIGGRCVARGDTTGPDSARCVLSDPAVEIAVLETARGGIARRGLGYDWSDISIITNIQPDHIGQDGIKSVKDLLYIKSLVAERVKEGGTLVLNADDEHLARLAENRRVRRLKKDVVYFSLHENHLLIRRHLAAGGAAYYVRSGNLIEARGHSESVFVRAGDIPLTLGGAAEFHVANLLAVIAACRAAGVTKEHIVSSLLSFQSDLHNPGRTNLYKVAGGYVMLDYGHNPDALRATCHMLSLWRDRTITGVVGVPGDRADSVIIEAGRSAARGFHRVIIKEDGDTRGRKRGEVAGLLRESIRREAPDCACSVILDDREALLTAIRQMSPGEIVVMFYDKIGPMLEILAEHDAVPASTIEGAMAHQASYSF